MRLFPAFSIDLDAKPNIGTAVLYYALLLHETCKNWHHATFSDDTEQAKNRLENAHHRIDVLVGLWCVSCFFFGISSNSKNPSAQIFSVCLINFIAICTNFSLEIHSFIPKDQTMFSSNARSSTMLLATVLFVSIVQRTTAMVSDLQMLVGIYDSDHQRDLEVLGNVASLSTMNRNHSKTATASSSTTTALPVTGEITTTKGSTSTTTKYVRVMNLVVPSLSSRRFREDQEEKIVTTTSPTVDQQRLVDQGRQMEATPCIDSSFASPISIPLVACTPSSSSSSSSSPRVSRTSSRMPFSYSIDEYRITSSRW